MDIPEKYHDHPAYGEAQMVLGPQTLPAAESIDAFDDWIIFRWRNNAATMCFDTTMVASVSFRRREADGSVKRTGLDFFLTDPIPEEFFENIEKSFSDSLDD